VSFYKCVVLSQDTFDICRKTFSSGEEMLRMSLSDKIDLFFHDYSLVPLFAFENYIGAIPFSSRFLLYTVYLVFKVKRYYIGQSRMHTGREF